MKKKNLYGLGLLACTLASAIFLKDVTIGIFAIPGGIYLLKMSQKEWDKLEGE